MYLQIGNLLANHVKVLLYDLAFYDQFGEKTEASCHRIWVIVPRYDHTQSLNDIIASIQGGTEKLLISERKKKGENQQYRSQSPNCSRRTR